MNPRPLVAIAVSHKDVDQATLWLRWTGFLAQQGGGDASGEQMVVMATQRASTRLGEIEASIPDRSTGMFRTVVTVCEDECEDGYPRSASHLFLRTLEYCEREFPGRSVLWCEPDTAPLRPSWFREIADEYGQCGHAFMGERVRHAGRNTSHVTGNSVYPHNWRELAPKLLTAHTAPDNPMFGPQSRGSAWDVFACDQTTADLHETKLIHQIFNISPFNTENLNRIRQGAALFHRCKNGTLITSLAKRYYPAFIETLPEPTETYEMIGHPIRLKTLGYPDMPWKAERTAAGWKSRCSPVDRTHGAILRCLRGSNGIRELSQSQPRSLASVG